MFPENKEKENKLSIGSESHSNIYVEDFSDGYLQSQVKNLQLQKQIALIENELLEMFFVKNDPSVLVAVQQAIEINERAESISGDTLLGQGKGSMVVSSAVKSPSRMMSKKVGASSAGGLTIGSGLKVNVKQRSDIVRKEIDQVNNAINRERKNIHRQVTLIIAHVEDIGCMSKENDVALERFGMQIGYLSDGTPNKTSAEQWIKYMNEWSRFTNAEVSRLRLITSTLKARHRQLIDLLIQKEELGKSLRPIDFEKIAIDNKLCSEAIAKKNAQLVAMKKTESSVNSTLTYHKNVLMEQTACMNDLYKKIEQKINQTSEIRLMKEAMKPRVRLINKDLQTVRSTRLHHEIPQILDYVKTKVEIHNLESNIKHLESIKIPKSHLLKLLRQRSS